MQFQINAAGKRIFPSKFKTKVLEELRAGATAHALGRKLRLKRYKRKNGQYLRERTLDGGLGTASSAR